MNQENRPIPEEAKRILDLRFSMAALLGSTLYNYGRLSLKTNFDGFEELEAKAAEADKSWTGKTASDESTKPVTQEQESPGQQTIQLMTLLHPTVRKVFGASAIYDILSNILSRFNRPGETLEEKIDGMNLVTLSGIWIVSKRVFALGHANDCSAMIDGLLSLMRGENPKPLDQSPMTSGDLDNIALFYKFYFTGYNEPEKEPIEKKREPSKTDELPSITTFTSTDKIFLPASKAFRNQQAIAASGFVIDPADGLEGRKLNVGTSGRPVLIHAMITAKDGKSPVQLSTFEMNIEAAIGQMFQMNGYKAFKCTPAQIYRVYAGLEPGDPVRPAQIEKVVKVMDKLIQTPATLNFAEQLEKHTRLKKRENFDYTDTNRVGTLITGVHDQRMTHTYNGTAVEHTFTIHEMPMFYAYSYAIGQIYTVSKYLLTGETPPPQEVQKKAQKKAASTRRLRSDDIDLRRYLLEHIEYQRAEKEKRYKKLKAYNKPIPPYFEFFLPFETVAEGINVNTDSVKTMRKIREQTYAFMLEQVKSPESPVSFADYYKKGKALHGVRVRI